MKKYIQKITHLFKTSETMITFLLGLIIIGIISGSLFAVIISKSDQIIVNEHLDEFLTLIKSNKLNNLDTFLNSISFNYFNILAIWTLGISVIGLPIIIFIFFSKPFVLGFTISTIIKKYGIKGCLLSFAYVFPHYIANILVFFVLTLFSLTLSLKMIKSIIKRKTIDFKLVIKKYTYVLFISLIIILLSSLYETFLMPKALNLILKLL